MYQIFQKSQFFPPATPNKPFSILPTCNKLLSENIGEFNTSIIALLKRENALPTSKKTKQKMNKNRRALEDIGFSLRKKESRVLLYKGPENLRFEESENNNTPVFINRVGKTVFTPEKPILLLSGTCLFGASTLKANTQAKNSISLVNPYTVKALTNEKITSFRYNENIHPFELDTVERIKWGMNIISVKNKVNLPICFQIPYWEYLNYGKELYRKGILSDKLYQQYCELVLERVQINTTLITERYSLPVKTITSPLKEASDFYLKDTNILNSKKNLSKSCDLWKKILEICSCETWIDINYLSYCYFYLKNIIDNPDKNIIALENPEERKIYQNSKKIAKKLGINFSLQAIYIQQKILVKKTKNNSPKTLFFIDDAGYRNEINQLIPQLYKI